ncbi:MAG: M24 family metallopeptidase [bacterium]|jgi:Xaa-Pro aminopeptidase
MKTRIANLRSRFAAVGVDGMLITRPENRAYLSGFSGSSGWLVVTVEKAYLLTDFRYTEQAGQEAPECTVVQHGRRIADTLREILRDEGSRRIGFEKDFVTYEQYETLRDKLPFAETVPLAGTVEELRMVKDTAELEMIAAAVGIADQAHAAILKYLRPGLTEKAVAVELEHRMKLLGSERNSFAPIVATGPRSSLPHGQPTERFLGRGEAVKMDFGAVYGGYCSDLTRTVYLGEVSARQKEIYAIVLAAQLAAIAAVKPGVRGCDVDAVARKIISDAGYGENFGHGLGHSVGRYIHENPRLAPGSEAVLAPGNVVTIEPGIYIPGWGGVRIEDMVVITETGCRVLTEAPKELTVIHY